MTCHRRLTPEEAYERVKSRSRKYYEQHKDKYHHYYIEHQTENSERMKRYRQENKDKISSYFKNKKFRCNVCGVDILIGSKSNHIKSKLHDYNTLKQRFQITEQRPMETQQISVQ